MKEKDSGKTPPTRLEKIRNALEKDGKPDNRVMRAFNALLREQNTGTVPPVRKKPGK